MENNVHQTYRLAERILGGRQGLADACGLSYHAVTFWYVRHGYMPLQYVPLVVAACGDPRITPQTLRPDYPHWEMLGRQLRRRVKRAERPAETPEPMAA